MLKISPLNRGIGSTAKQQTLLLHTENHTLPPLLRCTAYAITTTKKAQNTTDRWMLYTRIHSATITTKKQPLKSQINKSCNAGFLNKLLSAIKLENNRGNFENNHENN
jgi:hypothetical protein